MDPSSSIRDTIPTMSRRNGLKGKISSSRRLCSSELGVKADEIKTVIVTHLHQIRPRVRSMATSSFSRDWSFSKRAATRQDCRWWRSKRQPGSRHLRCCLQHGHAPDRYTTRATRLPCMTSVSWLGKARSGREAVVRARSRRLQSPPDWCTSHRDMVANIFVSVRDVTRPLVTFALWPISVLVYPTVFQLTFCLAGISLSRSCHVTKKKKPGLFRAPGFSILDPAASYSPIEQPYSTIGAGGLNDRVRDGIGCITSAIATGNWLSSSSSSVQVPSL
jgi:hypothetical protein